MVLPTFASNASNGSTSSVPSAETDDRVVRTTVLRRPMVPESGDGGGYGTVQEVKTGLPSRTTIPGNDAAVSSTYGTNGILDRGILSSNGNLVGDSNSGDMRYPNGGGPLSGVGNPPDGSLTEMLTGTPADTSVGAAPSLYPSLWTIREKQPDIYLQNQQGKLILVPNFTLQQFEALLQLRRQASRSDSMATWSIQAISTTGTVSEDRKYIELLVEYTIKTQTDELVRVPLLMKDAVFIQDESLAGTSEHLIIYEGNEGGFVCRLRGATEQTHRLRLRFQMPLTETAQGVRLYAQFPRSTYSILQIDLPPEVELVSNAPETTTPAASPAASNPSAGQQTESGTVAATPPTDMGQLPANAPALPGVADDAATAENKSNEKNSTVAEVPAAGTNPAVENTATAAATGPVDATNVADSTNTDSTNVDSTSADSTSTASPVDSTNVADGKDLTNSENIKNGENASNTVAPAVIANATNPANESRIAPLQVRVAEGGTLLTVADAKRVGQRSQIVLRGQGGPCDLTWIREKETQTLASGGDVYSNIRAVVYPQGEIRFTTNIQVHRPSERISKIRIRLPRGAVLVPTPEEDAKRGYTVTSMEDISTDISGCRLVEIQYAEERSDSADVALTAKLGYETLVGATAVELSGFEVLGMPRQSGELMLLGVGNWKAIPESPVGAKQKEDPYHATQTQEPDLLGTFEYYTQPFSLPVRLLPRQPHLSMSGNYRVFVTEEMLRLETVLEGNVTQAELRSLDLQFSGWTLDQVVGDGVTPSPGYVDDAQTLHIPLQQSVSGHFGLRITAHQALGTGAQPVRFTLPQPMCDSLGSFVLNLESRSNLLLIPQTDQLRGLVRIGRMSQLDPASLSVRPQTAMQPPPIMTTSMPSSGETNRSAASGTFPMSGNAGGEKNVDDVSSSNSVNNSNHMDSSNGVAGAVAGTAAGGSEDKGGANSSAASVANPSSTVSNTARSSSGSGVAGGTGMGGSGTVGEGLTGEATGPVASGGSTYGTSGADGGNGNLGGNEASDKTLSGMENAPQEFRAIPLMYRVNPLDAVFVGDFRVLEQKMDLYSTTHLRMLANRWEVLQRFQYQVRNKPAEYLYFEVPQSIASLPFEAIFYARNPGGRFPTVLGSTIWMGPPADAASGMDRAAQGISVVVDSVPDAEYSGAEKLPENMVRKRIMLPVPLLGDGEIQLRYSLNNAFLPGTFGEPVSLPIILPQDGQLRQQTCFVQTPESIFALLTDPDWKIVDLQNLPGSGVWLRNAEPFGYSGGWDAWEMAPFASDSNLAYSPFAYEANGFGMATSSEGTRSNGPQAFAALPSGADADSTGKTVDTGKIASAIPSGTLPGVPSGTSSENAADVRGPNRFQFARGAHSDHWLCVSTTSRRNVLPLELRHEDAATVETAIVERGWVRTWLAGNVREDHAVFMIRNNTRRNLTVELPPGVLPANVRVWLDGRLIHGIPSPDTSLLDLSRLRSDGYASRTSQGSPSSATGRTETPLTNSSVSDDMTSDTVRGVPDTSNGDPSREAKSQSADSQVVTSLGNHLNLRLIVPMPVDSNENHEPIHTLELVCQFLDSQTGVVQQRGKTLNQRASETSDISEGVLTDASVAGGKNGLKGLSGLNGMNIQIPHLGTDIRVHQMYWELVLPASEYLLSGPTHCAPEFVYDWDGIFSVRRPTLDTTELETWSHANFHFGPVSRVNRYLFSSVGQVTECGVRTVTRSSLVVLASGLILLIGLSLIYLRWIWRPITLLGLSVILFMFVFLAPELTILSLQASIPGWFAIGVAWIIWKRLPGTLYRNPIQEEDDSEELSLDSAQFPFQRNVNGAVRAMNDPTEVRNPTVAYVPAETNAFEPMTSPPISIPTGMTDENLPTRATYTGTPYQGTVRDGATDAGTPSVWRERGVFSPEDAERLYATPETGGPALLSDHLDKPLIIAAVSVGPKGTASSNGTTPTEHGTLSEHAEPSERAANTAASLRNGESSVSPAVPSGSSAESNTGEISAVQKDATTKESNVS